MNENEKMVTISEKEYKSLLDDAAFLQALQSCGVDNWEGYADARSMMEEE